MAELEIKEFMESISSWYCVFPLVISGKSVTFAHVNLKIN